jgi:hypothetical protein
MLIPQWNGGCFLPKRPGGPDYGQLMGRREVRFAKMLDGLRPESVRR